MSFLGEQATPITDKQAITILQDKMAAIEERQALSAEIRKQTLMVAGVGLGMRILKLFMKKRK